LKRVCHLLSFNFKNRFFLFFGDDTSFFGIVLFLYFKDLFSK
jgi:hypothetical protein